jgi:hypothetical protein
MAKKAFDPREFRSAIEAAEALALRLNDLRAAMEKDFGFVAEIPVDVIEGASRMRLLAVSALELQGYLLTRLHLTEQARAVEAKYRAAAAEGEA